MRYKIFPYKIIYVFVLKKRVYIDIPGKLIEKVHMWSNYLGGLQLLHCSFGETNFKRIGKDDLLNVKILSRNYLISD